MGCRATVRKAAPKGANAFVAAHPYLVAKRISNHLTLAGEFLGGKDNEHGHYAKMAARTTKADTAILAAVLAGFEADVTPQPWRNPQQTHRHYPNQLAVWGFEPSTVEKIIIGQ